MKIKHTHHFKMPGWSLAGTMPMHFAPVIADDDELTQAIEHDAEDRDDQWQLTERPDTNQLEQFWSQVEADVAKDPEWFTFSEE